MQNPSKEIYTEIIIRSSAEKVWNILIDFKSYPSWNPFIRSITGNPVNGEKLVVSIHPPNGKAMEFNPVVLTCEKNKEFSWLGKLFLNGIFDGEHRFELKDNGDGTITFIHQEQFKGILVPLLKNMLDTKTRQGFEAMNLKLKQLAEA